jgi:GH43 family beta-xylosidase
MNVRISAIGSCLVAAYLLAAGSGVIAAQTTAPTLGATTFTNPLLDVGPDPWVLTYQGFYYYMNTTQGNLTLWKTRDISDLRHAEKKVIWTPEPGQPWSKGVWAPEIHRWGDKWYVYFAADAEKNETHRIYVIENAASNPMEGDWVFKGKVSDTTDRWAIDASVFELNGSHYLLWSGWKGAENGEQDIFIAHMSNPWTIDSPRTLISEPTYAWEKVGDLPKGHVNVNEGPEALIHGGKIFVIFSASGCWTPNYELGAVVASTKSNLLNPDSWKKYNHPFFQQHPAAGVYAPGHNGFFRSQDGKQDWIIYHANATATDGCGNKRTPRMQPFTWNADGTPNFGTPVPAGKPLEKPHN